MVDCDVAEISHELCAIFYVLLRFVIDEIHS